MQTKIVKFISFIVVLSRSKSLLTIQVRLILKKSDTLLEVFVTEWRVAPWSAKNLIIKIAETLFTKGLTNGISVF